MTYANIADVALGDLIDETTFNQILANLRALYNAPSNSYRADEPSDYTTTSTSFTNVDGTNNKFSQQITLDALGDVLVGFTGIMNITAASGSRSLFLDFTVDGARQGLDDGILFIGPSSGSTDQLTSFTWLVRNLAAGTHTFNLQWRVTTSGASPVGTLYAGAGTSSKDIHPQFWVKKI